MFIHRVNYFNISTNLKTIVMMLKGKNLELISVTRQVLLDADFVCICYNCGRPIVNIATVKCENNKIYNIGLDCKKTLIDIPKINQIISINDWDANYKVKEYKNNLNRVTNFLKFCAYPNVEITINENNHIIIYDTKKENSFGNLGCIVYLENVFYLYNLGLQEFIKNLIKN